MSSGGHQCNVRCCSHQLASPSAHQTLDEMDFERGIWSAAMDGDLERVKSLLKKGTDPNLRDSANYTALHYASRSGHKSVCKFLLESGACANPQTPGGATPLHRSAYCGQLDVVQLLLHHGADPQLCDGDGSSPLHKAAEQSHEDVCRLLLQCCPSLRSHTNKKSQVPYQLAPDGHLKELLEPPQ
ncbi:ankyrin repeat domain-containing protein 39 [Oncorhynchus nerka]|uniref:Ankyrin repeat domain 39 n=3 Tax=Salmoninae TaxID=504568 RepID=A0A8C7IEP1_ONCKI|nr:ankyrin repeat domain-containing protein 39 [Oncorhynchus kisutch]XP_023834646.1 ankyrin repeat domain-containing protein 39 isoform X1 [Salvelinus alpinus]XP_023834647.1 ankyrin repeat domain-containing protein 39 isoform X1 [Salvelinus alpinus]XP_024294602.1 ankyrin repeat domain-containing protein 39 [Oncorhynchus tshawytscha]XP_029533852.1 ankyrin repeat domain-containing protein 39 [Oncorhynchus nerka]XP_035591852.1 ankyrin repeat domain-containing protein 39 [Oncorhynchus keta]XP_038